ncbi:MAG TPA: MauE/DoxX family redox-associated membrane protein [Ignavibacteria bacterium]|nr:DoxX family protein [Bacteroidota bacterium]HRE10726.1 MauE/DoxX family redox-associated membrane protein [Ignavibacteria bacterium]HRF66029.1 MauE/DoxX family redox-associated membrane protein [Ignavibacteria bacterium]HRJ02869.1 MauE/DoxX family redox-associated membrane protein [Ignavibacteria bacterium]
MKKLFENKYFVIAARIVLGAVFMYASFDKMANPEAFAKIIDNYHLLPYQLVNPLAIFLPWLELITGLLLITGKWVKGSLLIYNALLVIFIIALVQALIRGLDISCGCFSVNPSSTSEVWLRVIEDIALLFVSFMLLKHSKPGTEEIDEIENRKIINQTN